MDKTQLKGYMEFFSFLPDYPLNKELRDLDDAARETAIHTFGWPIGISLPNEEYRPKPYQDGIRCVIERDRSHISDDGSTTFDYWTLNKNGDYYILASLFEDSDTSNPNRIFFDSRTVRTTETFLRTANLYKALGVPEDQEMECKIEYGGLEGRVLSAANSARLMHDNQVCRVPSVHKIYRMKIKEFTHPDFLKKIVFETVKEITQSCDGKWIPSKAEVIDPIVDNFLNGKIT